MRNIVRMGSVVVAGLGAALAGGANADHGRHEEVIRARLGGYNAVYVNIHSTPSPPGEIRGQIF